MKADYPNSLKEKVTSYLLVMEEVKSRIAAINAALASGLQPILIAEICYLEFRHISELIAIGCLLAYGDFKSYRTFEKEYSPKEIFKHLEKLFPYFFPQPVKRWIDDKGSAQIEANTKPNALTRQQMEDLWAISGDHLHRLSISKFFKPRPPRPNALDEVKLTRDKIIDLLNDHLITIPSPRSMLLVSMAPPNCRVLAQILTYGESNTLTLEEFKLQ